jgi:nicotinamide-nucleotide amidase
MARPPAPLVAEVIAIGSEMLFAGRVDTNSSFIAAHLDRFGVPLVAKTIVGDDVATIRKALAIALTRSDFIFLTGGLGPTEDDLTREAASEALGLELVYHPKIVDEIEARFQRLGRKMPEINRRQGYVLETARALENNYGTAPGQYLVFEGRHIFLLPGPPRELRPIVERHLISLLQDLGLRPGARRYFRVAGLPESQADSLISPIYRRYPTIRCTILASPGDIEIYFLADHDGNELQELTAKVAAALGDNVFATEEINLEDAVGRMLAARRATLSVAESCTGGMLGETITRTPGSSAYFLGGVLAYSNALKEQLLDVSPEILAQHGAVSGAAAEAMAQGIRRRTGSDFALSITGIAGPDGGTEEKPVGTVFIGLSDATKTTAHRYQLGGERSLVRLLSVRTALNLLRKELQRNRS